MKDVNILQTENSKTVLGEDEDLTQRLQVYAKLTYPN